MSDRKTVLEEGTTFKGTLNATTPVVVMGDLEGDITGPEVEVTESGAITGKVTAKTLRSRGRLSGEFEADDVELGGRVIDKTVVRAKSLAVAITAPIPTTPASNGSSDAPPETPTPAIVFGECEIRVGDEPSKEQAIAEALAPP